MQDSETAFNSRLFLARKQSENMLLRHVKGGTIIKSKSDFGIEEDLECGEYILYCEVDW